MAKIGASFKRGTKTQIENTSVVDGQVLWETDQGGSNKIYNDVGTTRVQIGGDTDVVDVLDSTSVYDALSANMGRELNETMMPKTGGTFTGTVTVSSASGIAVTSSGLNSRWKVTSTGGTYLTAGNGSNSSVRFINDSTNDYVPCYASDFKNADGVSMMPKSGGTFTGNAIANSTNRSGDFIRNIAIKLNDGTTVVSTNSIIFTRK